MTLVPIVDVRGNCRPVVAVAGTRFGVLLVALGVASAASAAPRAVACAIGGGALAGDSVVAASDRTAGEILRDFDSVHYPSFSDGSDPESVARFEQAIRDAAQRQQALALELATAHRAHARVAEVLRLRWTLFCTVQADGERVLRETDEWLARRPDLQLARAAAATRALAALTIPSLPFDERRAIVEASRAAAPEEKLVIETLLELALEHAPDPAVQRELAAEAAALPGTEPYRGEIRLVERLVAQVGRPLVLDFDGPAADATADAPRSTRDLHGKPCLLRSRYFAGDWIGDEERAQGAAFEQLRAAFPAEALPCLTLVTAYDDAPAAGMLAQMERRRCEAPLWIERATFERSLLRTALGVDREGLNVLLDSDGVVRAWSFRLEPLRPHVEQLLRPREPKRRRAI